MKFNNVLYSFIGSEQLGPLKFRKVDQVHIVDQGLAIAQGSLAATTDTLHCSANNHNA